MNLKDNFIAKFVTKKANETSKLAKKILKPVKKFFKTIGVKISITVNGEPQKGGDENSAQRESQEKTQNTKSKDGAQETKTSGEENRGEESSKESEKERKKSDDETINKETAAEKESEEKPRKEKLSKKKKSLAQEEYAESSSFKQITLTTFLSILDIVASLVFMVAVVVAIKPSLLTDEISKPLYNYSFFCWKNRRRFGKNKNHGIQSAKECRGGATLSCRNLPRSFWCFENLRPFGGTKRNKKSHFSFDARDDIPRLVFD